MAEEKTRARSEPPQAPAPAYWAVLPSDVRYDPDIPPLGRILYAEVSALCGPEGYCWASNGYFAKLYSRDERTIGRLLSQLVKKGHIILQVERSEKGEVVCRKIWTKATLPAAMLQAAPLPTKMSGPSRQKCQDPPDKNVGKNNINNNNITPLPPKGAGARGASDPEKDEAFMTFWKLYPKKKNRPLAYRSWRRQKAGQVLDQVLAALERDKQSRQWTKDSGEFIPYPSTWLNARPWEDEPDELTAPADQEPEGWGYDAW